MLALAIVVPFSPILILMDRRVTVEFGDLRLAPRLFEDDVVLLAATYCDLH